MRPRETCSSYSSLQRISKINYIIYESKDRSTVDHSAPVFFCCVRLAAHVSNGLKSRIRPVVGRI